MKMSAKFLGKTENQTNPYYIYEKERERERERERI
jgi:hypothetical protein